MAELPGKNSALKTVMSADGTALKMCIRDSRYDAESEEGLELEPEETQAPSGLANADVSNLQRSDLETAAEAALGE